MKFHEMRTAQALIIISMFCTDVSDLTCGCMQCMRWNTEQGVEAGEQKTKKTNGR